MRTRVSFFFPLALFAFLVTTGSQALLGAGLPPGFSESAIASGLAFPTAMALAPDGRIFITQQGGLLRVVKDDLLLPTAAVSLTVDANGERGLLGVALDPAFNTNHFIYLYYTVPTAPIHNRVSRFTLNGDVVTPGTEIPLLDLDNLSGATNHNGGALHFGLDGKLYIAVGENANGANSQTLTNRLGKLLRVNSDGSIPADNPFFGTATGLNRAIWVLGLRNPFTFAVQPGTGRMFINDVGQNTFEEINDGIAMSNYGWPTTEGTTTDPNFRSPLFTYTHTPACAITGGTFYNPAVVRFPAATYVGKYFFSDLCAQYIHVFDPAAPATAQNFATGINAPVDLQVDGLGRLYYLAYGNGNNGVLARVSAATPATNFFTVPPCRAIDTRTVNTPAIAANTTRSFVFAGQCGVPMTAKSVSVNVTVIPSQTGSVVPFAGDYPLAPFTSVINFNTAQTRSNNAIVELAINGNGTMKVFNKSVGATQVVIDVNGYFQ